MGALVVLIAVLVVVVGLVVWADVKGWDPFADLYGSDYTAPWNDRDPGDLS